MSQVHTEKVNGRGERIRTSDPLVPNHFAHESGEKPSVYADFPKFEYKGSKNMGAL
jgi:hypothetical protein